MTSPATLTLTPRWTDNPPDSLTAQTGSSILAGILAARGVFDVDELDLAIGGLLPASSLLGIDKAVAVIDKAIDDNKKILIVGDFDCDGATSTALMVRALRTMGATVDFLVPDRFYFGYGLTTQLVQYAYDNYQPNLIVTVDNGISSHDGVLLANSLGMEVVITDHHLTTSAAPEASAVVNPNQIGCGFGSKALVGVGVAFYVMGVLAKTRRQAGKRTDTISRYLDLVALGTVADMGVFDKNNRILIAHGLQKIRQGDCCVGILAILAQAGRDCQQIGVQDFGFAVAPRINAAGRMDNMRVGVECLLTDDVYEANSLAATLDELNIERRNTETTMKQTAEEMLDTLVVDDNKRAVILYDDTWHQGVIGIVAGRIKEKLYLPTLIFAPNDTQKIDDDDLIKASARSIAGVHIRDMLVELDKRQPKLICHFGGHAMAAGLTIYKKDFERFCQAFYELMDELPRSVFYQQKFTDGMLGAGEISLSFVKELKHLSLWGHGFEYPHFDGVFEIVFTKILKQKHLKLVLRHPDIVYPIDAIWFNYKHDIWDYRASRVHVLYELDINEWNGQQKVQLVVQDLAVMAISEFA